MAVIPTVLALLLVALSPEDARVATSMARATLIAEAGGRPTAYFVDNLPPALRRPAPVFVTVVLDGATRACQGTLSPATPSLADEIALCAQRAADGDARHPGLSRVDIRRARVVISLPSGVEPLAQGREVDPRRWGLVVETSDGAGILLPGEARTFEWMLREARRRAGASKADPGAVSVFRTTVIGEGAIPSLEERRQ